MGLLVISYWLFIIGNWLLTGHLLLVAHHK